MKVLVVCAIDHTVKLLLSAQVRALESAGHEVHVACSRGDYVESLIRDGFKIKTVEMARRLSPLTNVRSLVSLVRLMRRERYDAVHVHTFSASVIGRVAAALARVPLVIYTFRGFAFHPDSPWPVKWFNVVPERLCRRLTDFFFSQSEENRLLGVCYGIVDEARSLTIGNGVAVEEFADPRNNSDEAASAVRAELKISNSAFVVGMVGRLVREKGVVEFFEAAVEISRAYPEAVFLVVGDTFESDRTGIAGHLRDLVGKNGLESRFFFTGYRLDTARLYAAMDVFVLPTYREGMPRSVIEAMASGRPVVASDIPGCREEVVEGQTGFLVPARDSAALAAAVMKVLADPVRARRMGSEGRKRAFGLFDERLVCERIVSAYDRLMKERFGSARTRKGLSGRPEEAK